MATATEAFRKYSPEQALEALKELRREDVSDLNAWLGVAESFHSQMLPEFAKSRREAVAYGRAAAEVLHKLREFGLLRDGTREIEYRIDVIEQCAAIDEACTSREVERIRAILVTSVRDCEGDLAGMQDDEPLSAVELSLPKLLRLRALRTQLNASEPIRGQLVGDPALGIAFQKQNYLP